MYLYLTLSISICLYWNINKRGLTSKWASHQSGVHLFNILISKNFANRSVVFGLQMCFAPQQHTFSAYEQKTSQAPHIFGDFDLQMCFAPQRRPIFAHRCPCRPLRPLLYRADLSTILQYKQTQHLAWYQSITHAHLSWNLFFWTTCCNLR